VRRDRDSEESLLSDESVNFIDPCICLEYKAMVHPTVSLVIERK